MPGASNFVGVSSSPEQRLDDFDVVVSGRTNQGGFAIVVPRQLSRSMPDAVIEQPKISPFCNSEKEVNLLSLPVAGQATHQKDGCDEDSMQCPLDQTAKVRYHNGDAPQSFTQNNKAPPRCPRSGLDQPPIFSRATHVKNH